ncbi:NAD(P)-binding protein [Atractiella rhizophila]|nr:NAD(P)-binding protein [Atractiella rhizophila]
MKAYVIKEWIPPSKLASTLTETSDPVPKANEVLVDVSFAGFNFFDLLQVEGKYQVKPPFPFIPGAEFSGVVSKDSPIPKGCPFVPGKTRVFGTGQGAYAEKIAVPWTTILEVPQKLSLEQAAGLHLTYPTSYAGLVLRGKLQKGEWLLVHAGAGGVGLSAVQIGKALGARVIATASTQEKLDVCKREGGADFVINYTEKDWQKKVLEITKGKGADVIYDPVGMLVPSLKCIAWNGRAIVVGFAGGAIEKIPANLVLLKNISIVGLHWGAYARNEKERMPEVWAGVFDLIQQGKLKVVVFHKIYEGLESVPEGLFAVGARKTYGKAVCRVTPKSKL